MTGSKRRPLWDALPAQARALIERLLSSPVVAAQTCEGGFSPGFASRLTLADGRRAFVKAMDNDAWPRQADMHRAEAAIAAVLPSTIPAPRFLGSLDDGHWVTLAFDDIDGAQPAQPWNRTDLDRVLAAIGQLAQAGTPSPIALPRDHPRLGGWASLAHDASLRARLPACSAWAASHLPLLTKLEDEGLAAAQGPSLVHFDMYPHNILLTADQVLFADWPHARLGAPFIDLLLLLSTAAASGIDPDPILASQPLTAHIEPHTIDAVLAAHAGFCLVGALLPAPPGLEPITDAKLALGRSATKWLQQRIAPRPGAWAAVGRGAS
jgi:aminoglycoside phosphotransferase (APT) family kinase protein